MGFRLFVCRSWLQDLGSGLGSRVSGVGCGVEHLSSKCRVLGSRRGFEELSARFWVLCSGSNQDLSVEFRVLRFEFNVGILACFRVFEFGVGVTGA